MVMLNAMQRGKLALKTAHTGRVKRLLQRNLQTGLPHIFRRIDRAKATIAHDTDDTVMGPDQRARVMQFQRVVQRSPTLLADGCAVWIFRSTTIASTLVKTNTNDTPLVCVMRDEH
jgi:hypothetical protein